MKLAIDRLRISIFLLSVFFVKSLQGQENCCFDQDYHNIRKEQSIAYLFWGAMEDYLGFAIKNIAEIPQRPTKMITHRNPSWNSGVRL